MSYSESLLTVPYHRQDCPGYCALGCVTMILDAHHQLPSGGFSQVAAYTSIYRNPGPPGSSSPAGHYDRWHVSPWQLQTLLQPLGYEVDHDSPAGIGRLLRKVKEAIDAAKPSIVLLSYDGLASAGKHHASGTHWVVVYGYSSDATGVTGYYTRDPWRGWAPKTKEDPSYLHQQSHWGGTSCCKPYRPEAIASWQRSPFEGPHNTTAPVAIKPSDLAKGVFGGIRTDGNAYVLTVNPHAPPLTNTPKEEIPKGAQIKVKVAEWPKLLHPLFINGIEPGGGSASVPPEFAQAMGDANDYMEEEVVRTDQAAGGGYRLTIWAFPINNKLDNQIRIVAWTSKTPALAEPSLDGAAVLNSKWPGIQPRVGGMLESGGEFKLIAPDPNPDPDWPELKEFFYRLKSFVDDFNSNPMRFIRVSRLVWEPCIASLSPALPFYDAEFILPAVGTKPALAFRALIDLEGRIHRRLRRSSKAGG